MGAHVAHRVVGGAGLGHDLEPLLAVEQEAQPLADDRMIVGGAMPADKVLPLEAIKPTGTEAFLDRRELVAVNIGGAGTVTADGLPYEVAARDMVYLGMGTQQVSFASGDSHQPAKFYLLSVPAHQAYPSRLIRVSDARRLDLGSQSTSNERSIFQFIHADGAKAAPAMERQARLRLQRGNLRGGRGDLRLRADDVEVASQTRRETLTGQLERRPLCDHVALGDRHLLRRATVGDVLARHFTE